MVGSLLKKANLSTPHRPSTCAAIFFLFVEAASLGMGTFTVHVINVKILPCARIVEKPLYTTLIVDRLVTLIVVLRTLNM